MFELGYLNSQLRSASMETAVWNIVIMIKESSPDPSGHSWKSFWSGVGEWFEEHWVEVAVGSVVVIGGAAVTALTCGAGTTAWAAFGAALLSSASQVGIACAHCEIGSHTNRINCSRFDRQ